MIFTTQAVACFKLSSLVLSCGRDIGSLPVLYRCSNNLSFLVGVEEKALPRPFDALELSLCKKRDERVLEHGSSLLHCVKSSAR